MVEIVQVSCDSCASSFSSHWTQYTTRNTCDRQHSGRVKITQTHRFFPLPDDWHGVACDCVFICHSMLPLLFSPYSMWTTETNMWYWNRSSIYPFLTQCVAASKSILLRCSRSTFIRFKYGVEFGLCVPSKSYCVPYFDLFAFSISFVRSLFPYH